jgi:hypothetical protein
MNLIDRFEFAINYLTEMSIFCANKGSLLPTSPFSGWKKGGKSTQNNYNIHTMVSFILSILTVLHNTKIKLNTQIYKLHFHTLKSIL